MSSAAQPQALVKWKTNYIPCLVLLWHRCQPYLAETVSFAWGLTSTRPK